MVGVGISTETSGSGKGAFLTRNIPEEMQKLPHWVCSLTGSKVPYQITGEAAKTSDPTTWTDFETAVQAVDDGLFDGIGFVFNGSGFVGIDIDDGFDQDGLPTEKAADIIGICDSYTEISRSGRGFHIIVKASLPFPGKNNRDGVEIYQAGRYFIMTGKMVFQRSICDNDDAVMEIIARYFSSDKQGQTERTNARFYTPRWVLPDNGRIPIRPVYDQIGDGCRNASLASIAGLLHRIGYRRGDIVREIMRVNREACCPPLPQYEVESICNSITRYRREL